MRIERASCKDAVDLTNLTIDSKAYWGYSSKQMMDWKEVLTISEKYIDENIVYKLFVENKLIGYYSYFMMRDSKVKLDNIFIRPQFIRKGYGKILIEHLIETAKKEGVEMILLDSEPHAENFYKALGFNLIGYLESSIKDRFLPVMELKL